MSTNNETITRVVHVLVTSNMYEEGRTENQIAAYLPKEYHVSHTLSNVNDFGDVEVVIHGHDFAGWTAEDYVVPRLQSGLWAAKVVA